MLEVKKIKYAIWYNFGNSDDKTEAFYLTIK